MPREQITTDGEVIDDEPATGEQPPLPGCSEIDEANADHLELFRSAKRAKRKKDAVKAAQASLKEEEAKTYSLMMKTGIFAFQHKGVVVHLAKGKDTVKVELQDQEQDDD